MITFRIESNPLDEFKKLYKLFDVQREELGMFGDDIPLKINWEGYRILQEFGKLFAFVVESESEVVGYALFAITRHMHYDVMLGVNDVFYLAEGYRKGRAGIRLIKCAENELRLRGVSIVVWSVKPRKDYSAVLKYLKYNLLEYNYFRRL